MRVNSITNNIAEILILTYTFLPEKFFKRKEAFSIVFYIKAVVSRGRLTQQWSWDKPVLHTRFRDTWFTCDRSSAMECARWSASTRTWAIFWEREVLYLTTPPPSPAPSRRPPWSVSVEAWWIGTYLFKVPKLYLVWEGELLLRWCILSSDQRLVQYY